MSSHEIDFEIIGHDIQLVEIELDPEETVIAEAGAMAYMEQDIQFEARMGDGSEANSGVMGKLFGVGKRLMTGESIFMTHFTNEGGVKRKVAFSASIPGSVVPIDLSRVDGEIICQKDAFLVAAKGTAIDVTFSKRLGAGFFGGEGFVLQRLQGDGMVFIHAGGTLVRRELKNETLRLDTGCLVGFTKDIDYDIALAGGLKSMLFGGEGLCLATLSGTGSVWIQSMPFPRLVDRIVAAIPKPESAGDN